MNKPRLKFEIYRWPISIMPDFEGIPDYNKGTRCASVFGLGAGIRVGTYYKAALNGMQEAIIPKEIEYESPEYEEYYKLDDEFREILTKTTDIKFIKEEETD